MTVRATPRMSISKLGEYLTAAPARRRTIVRDQKYPKAFRTTWYADARNSIASYLVGPRNDLSLLEAAADRLEARRPKNDYDSQRIGASLDAIDSFANFAETLDFGRYNLSAGATRGSLTVSGVTISVRPDLLLADRQGVRGAIVLYLVRANPLDINSGAYVSTLLHRFVAEQIKDALEPARSSCMVIDVMDQRVYSAPTAYKRRMDDIAAACEEIAARWASI